MTTQWKQFAVVCLSGTAVLALNSAAIAQDVDARSPATASASFSGCANLSSAACISQIGDGNSTIIDQRSATSSRAAVRSDGNKNVVSVTQSKSDNRASIAIDGSSNSTTLVQAGQGNKAVVNIEGNNNGTGTIKKIGDGADVYLKKQVTVMVQAQGKPEGTLVPKVIEVAADRPIRLPTNLQSGLIKQDGPRNTAEVSILDGNNNDFFISQEVGDNKAFQTVGGNNNLAVIIQASELGAGNEARQTQNGSNNIAYTKQTGGGNFADLSQGRNSTILLEQENDFNRANLTQTNANNFIALRQTGGATISISQNGGRSISIEQSAGTYASGITVTQN